MRPRLSGVLLHISSLPSRYGIGDLGPEAHAFARLLALTGQSVWQVLPLGPTSPAIGNSPYSSPSAFAGNLLFVSPELMFEEGFIGRADMEAACAMETRDGEAARYETAGIAKNALLDKAFENNAHRLAADAPFTRFVETNRFWLEDYARFMTIKAAHGGAAWTLWPEPLARRHAEALAAWDAREARAMQRERFVQFLFFRQWRKLRELCAGLGIRMVGDIPLYVTHDSADVWAHPEYFQLDENGRPKAVAGVPPDYFSPTGQRWGNPLYAWNRMAADGFQWWLRRLGHNLDLFDCVRLDHFRGFAGYWEVPATEETAVNGRWADAPGQDLFAAFSRKFPGLPLIAEDLGVITPDVRELQRDFSLPGMAVLQFGFSGELRKNPHAPFMHKTNQVVYTGTHDNAPARGWFCASAARDERDTLAAYAGHDITEDNAAATLIRLALASVASMAVVPVQDILGLPESARMNTPSTTENNWTWRLGPGQLNEQSMARFAQSTAFFGRHAGSRG